METLGEALQALDGYRESREMLGYEELVIDGETRVISVPASEALFGVESDKNTERKHFRCPRFVGDNVDLLEYGININYQNANREKSVYVVEDVQEDEGTGELIFSWLLSGPVTKYVGNVDFIVCAVKSDGQVLQNEWNTTVAQARVIVGLEVKESLLPADETNVLYDLLEQTRNVIEQNKNQSDKIEQAIQTSETLNQQVQEQQIQIELLKESLNQTIREAQEQLDELNKMSGNLDVLANLGEAATSDIIDSLQDIPEESTDRNDVLGENVGREVMATFESIGQNISSVADDVDKLKFRQILSMDNLDSLSNEATNCFKVYCSAEVTNVLCGEEVGAASFGLVYKAGGNADFNLFSSSGRRLIVGRYNLTQKLVTRRDVIDCKQISSFDESVRNSVMLRINTVDELTALYKMLNRESGSLFVLFERTLMPELTDGNVTVYGSGYIQRTGADSAKVLLVLEDLSLLSGFYDNSEGKLTSYQIIDINSKLDKSGGTMSGTIKNDIYTGTYRNAYDGKSVIDTSAGDGVRMLLTSKGRNGKFVFGTEAYHDNNPIVGRLIFGYITDEMYNLGANNMDAQVDLLNEDGNSYFSGIVSVNKIKSRTPLKISLTGAVTGEVTTDLSGNITIDTVLGGAGLSKALNAVGDGTLSWQRVGSFDTTFRNSDKGIVFAVSDGYLDASFGILSLHVRTDSTKVVKVQYIWDVKRGFNNEDFVLLYKEGEEVATFDLWVYVRNYSAPKLFVLSQFTRTGTANFLKIFANPTKSTDLPTAGYTKVVSTIAS